MKKKVTKRVKRFRHKIGIIIKIVFIFIFLYSCPLNALDPGQSIDQYVLDSWNIADGLPSNMVFSIAQTPDGYMWFATTKGLVRYDGVKFSAVQYKKQPEIKNKRKHLLDILLVDKTGNLWIGGLGHLTRYNYQTGQFTTFTKKDGLAGHRVYCLDEDSKGNLWIGFMGCYLQRFADNKFTSLNPYNGLEGNWVTSITEDKNGNLMVGTYKKGVFKLQEGKCLKYKIGGIEANIQKIHEDREGILWIGTNNGLFRVIGTTTDTRKVTDVYTTRNGLLNNDILDIMEDGDGNLWIATLKGLNRMEEDQSGRVVFKGLLPGHVVTRLFEDRENNLWIATDESGIIRLKNAVFVEQVMAKKSRGDIMYSIFEDRQGNTWIGGHSGKLYKYKNGQCIDSLEIPGISGTPISAIEEDIEGNLWVGTSENGVFQIQRKSKTVKNFNTQDGLADKNVFSIFNDSKSNLWFSTLDGLSRYRNGYMESFNVRDGLLGRTVYNVCEDKNHHIWIATNKGLNIIKNRTFTKNNMRGYLKDIVVTCIYLGNASFNKNGNENVCWIGTHGAGLKRFQSGKVISYTTAEGMSSNYIYKIFADEQDNFWMMSDIGVLRVSIDDLEGFAHNRVDTINCTTYGISDGMKSTYFYNRASRNSSLKTQKGELWFITKKGITAVDPGRIKINQSPPPVVIEQVVLNGQLVPLNREGNEFKGKKDIVIHFTAPTFISANKIKFKYKLFGYDKYWTFLSPGEKRVACYKNVPPGTYTFRVIAGNRYEVWNRVGDSLTFVSRPLFHETIPFKVSLSLVFLLFAASATYMLYLYMHKKPPFVKNGKIKYKNSLLNPLYVDQYLKKLNYFMEVEKVFRDETISLQSLSEKLSIPPYRLSQIINEKLNKGFSDFINTYRIEEAKKLLTHPKWGEQKILSIAFEVGFNTKAAFNYVFKKYTGMTPTQYKKRKCRLKNCKSDVPAYQ
jgi:ligand-binding sensor domain-containing protein/AraC-like DNA-binding protein